ncbi:hypothetical protein FOXG_19619 [Fusarium oxysporum f. sp. lycopersici 4287]|uniref:Uncharacterized protein n=1 Tax=Fusarium oxysporum f. sp. lycopersici (strain 4287 / CBS 123668 / FGSC 9935 / NRRL 34936) TaxID=426428 RepID=A0A0J9WMX1_FUSO4|nr:hypothetical protein FOXG_19619 [Fusarium oxysporum f. sp. lycopersici 4287]EWZ95654.1 hypothetical protein FOWG_05530 [Fusarium oxysporum f. sp. lycopersici MN25]KAJ9419674.1 hypothetical protein QL093DRAFT_2371348 [Fusarium oxysporum]KNB06272.1 hypothetical protein FOXG_19619 [Fusarium oxysporum f. sp. lycopersici 4287]
MASRNNSACHAWTHRTRRRVLKNDVSCFRYEAAYKGAEVVISELARAAEHFRVRMGSCNTFESMTGGDRNIADRA